MGHSLPSSYLLNSSFDDIDDLTQQARQWNVDFRQLERGHFSGELFQFGTSGVHITDARFRRSLQQKGTPPAGMRTIAVPASSDVRFEWRGRSIDGNSLMVFPKGGELSSVSGTDFHVYTLTFDEHLLAEVGDALELGDLEQTTKGQDAIQAAPEATDQLRELLGGICQSIRDCQENLNSSQIATQVTSELPERILTAIAEAQGGSPDALKQKRMSVMAKAEAYIERHAADNIDMDDVCRAAGVSQRTLRYAFVERFGIGPKEYLQAFRLIQVRRDLRAAEPSSARVADVANAWGFWHMGQFAADYRDRFDELPSQTLSRIAKV